MPQLVRADPGRWAAVVDQRGNGLAEAVTGYLGQTEVVLPLILTTDPTR